MVVTEEFKEAEAEMKNSPHQADLLEKDTDATVERLDRIMYKLEVSHGVTDRGVVDFSLPSGHHARLDKMDGPFGLLAD